MRRKKEPGSSAPMSPRDFTSELKSVPEMGIISGTPFHGCLTQKNKIRTKPARDRRMAQPVGVDAPMDSQPGMFENVSA
jgi:hypothetical protein